MPSEVNLELWEPEVITSKETTSYFYQEVIPMLLTPTVEKKRQGVVFSWFVFWPARAKVKCKSNSVKTVELCSGEYQVQCVWFFTMNMCDLYGFIFQQRQRIMNAS